MKATATAMAAELAAIVCSSDWHCSPATRNHTPTSHCCNRACSTLQLSRKTQGMHRLDGRSWTSTRRLRWEWTEAEKLARAETAKQVAPPPPPPPLPLRLALPPPPPQVTLVPPQVALVVAACWEAGEMALAMVEAASEAASEAGTAVVAQEVAAASATVAV